MDSTTAGGRASVAGSDPRQAEAIEFVRFCYRRRRVGWPELYDEMCAVAGRGLYQGYRWEELASIGIGFGLSQMPGLAAIVGRVIDEDVERRQRSAAAVRASLPGELSADAQPAVAPAQATHDDPGATEVAGPGPGAIRLALATGA